MAGKETAQARKVAKAKASKGLGDFIGDVAQHLEQDSPEQLKEFLNQPIQYKDESGKTESITRGELLYQYCALKGRKGEKPLGCDDAQSFTQELIDNDDARTQVADQLTKIRAGAKEQGTDLLGDLLDRAVDLQEQNPRLLNRLVYGGTTALCTRFLGGMGALVAPEIASWVMESIKERKQERSAPEAPEIPVGGP